MDCDFRLDRCDFVMGPKARILIQPGKRLLIGEGTWLHSCGQYMWEGIIVDAQGNPATGVAVYTGGPIIEEALNAITVNLPGYVRMGLSTMNRNYKNIKIVGTANTVQPKTILQKQMIASTQITCKTGGVYTNIGVMPHQADRTNCGVELVNVESTKPDEIIIGQPDQYYSSNIFIGVNTFSNMDYGVIVRNSDAKIYNNYFLDLDKLFDVNAHGYGAGVLVSNTLYPGRVTIGDLSTINQPVAFITPENNFYNCRIGVQSIRSLGNCTVNFNTLSKISSAGVSTINCWSSSLNISSNLFIDNNTGINTQGQGIDNLGLTNLISISGNTFNLTRANVPQTNPPFNYNGIVIQNAILSNFPTNNAAVSINYNNINGEFLNGINLNSLSRPLVDHNVLYFKSLALNASNPKLGIWMQNCSKGTITNNAFRPDPITYPSPSTYLANSIGLFVDKGGYSIVAQNSFYGIENGLYYFNSNLGSLIQCNYFDLANNGIVLNSSDVLDQGNITSPSDNQWNDISASVTTDIYGISSFVQRNWFFPNGFTGYPFVPGIQFPPIANGNNPAKINYATTGPGICNPNPCPNCRPIQLTEIINRLMNDSTLTMEDVNSIKESLFIEIGGDSSLFTSVSPTDSVIVNFYNQMLTTSKGVLLSNAYKVSINDSSAMSIVEQVVPANSFEVNFQNGLNAIKYYTNDTNRSNQYFDSTPTINMALDNAYYAGSGVFIARALTSNFGVDEIISSLRSFNPLNKPITTNDIRLFPNPTSSDIQIESLEAMSCLEIFDLTGKLLFKLNNLHNFTSNIDLRKLGLKAGVFNLRITTTKVTMFKIVYLGN